MQWVKCGPLEMSYDGHDRAGLLPIESCACGCVNLEFCWLHWLGLAELLSTAIEAEWC